MKKSILLLGIVLLAACNRDAKNYIAKVNGEGIDRVMFEKYFSLAIQQTEKMGRQVTEEMRLRFRNQLFDNMVSDKLMLQAGNKNGIVVTPAQLDARMKEIKAGYPSEADFIKTISEQGFNEATARNRVRDMMIREEVVNKIVFAKIATTPQEVSDFFNANKARFSAPPQVRASHILLNFKGDETAPGAAAKKAELEMIRKEIVANKISFADAAKKYSDCPSKTKGGDLDFFGPNRMVPEFEKMAFSTPKGQISPVFKTQFGYHIVMVTDTKPATEATLENSAKQVEEQLINQKKNSSYRAYLSELKRTATIISFLEKPAANPATPIKPVEPTGDVKK